MHTFVQSWLTFLADYYDHVSFHEIICLFDNSEKNAGYSLLEKVFSLTSASFRKINADSNAVICILKFIRIRNLLKISFFNQGKIIFSY